MITLDSIEKLFTRMTSSGVDVKNEMLYGYFFTNSTPVALRKILREVEDEGFNLVDIYQDKNDLFWLHVERVEIHTARSLFNLNSMFYEKANKYKLESYDGFDIGNKDKAQL